MPVLLALLALANDDEGVALNKDRVDVEVYKFMMYTDSFKKDYYAFEHMTGGIYCGAVFWRLLLSIWGAAFFAICIGIGYVPKWETFKNQRTKEYLPDWNLKF